MLQVSHTNTGNASVRRNADSAQSTSQSVGAVSILAKMYSRIPGHLLNQIQGYTPMNYSCLDLAEFAQLGNRPPTPVRDPIDTQWHNHQFHRECTLATALGILERCNSSKPKLQKIKLNFTNGAQMMFSRSAPTDPETLQCVNLYDPGAAFNSRTHNKILEESRAQNAKKLKQISDDRGRALRPPTNKSPSRKTFSPEKLYHGAPPPTVGSVGFDFTPVSCLSFQVRPNTQVTGCRPSIRDTNPRAVEFRPRSLQRPISPNQFEAVDGRNRLSAARIR